MSRSSKSPELWKPFPAIASEPRRPTPAVSPGSWKPGPPGSPRPWKSSPSATSGPWKSSKPVQPMSPGPWKPIPSVSPGPWKPAPSMSTASWKSSVSSGSWKTPPTSPESWKSGPPELRKTALPLSPELSEEIQLEAVDNAKCDSLAQEGLLATPKKLLDEALSPSSKKLKKDSQENSDAELSSSEYIRADLDTLDTKGQESSSDQEQVDVESIDFSKENKMEMGSTEQAKNVLQFTEEKEAFISEEEIAKYMKRGKGKYYCKICCCRAMKKGAVLHHLVNKHNVHSPYKCTICGKAFLLESLLKNHVAAHGQSLLKCPRCNFESNFPRGFKKHLTHCQSRHNEEVNKKLMEALESPLEEQQI